MKLSEKMQEAVSKIESCFAASGLVLPHPRTAIILGSGLNSLVSMLDEHLAVPYGDIPHCRASRAPGHTGRLVLGTLAGHEVVCMQGRLHTYEGKTPLETTFPLLVAQRLGATRLIATNAAGAVNEGFEAGDLMLITDHINNTATAPVTFDEENDLITTFFDMSHVYTESLQQRARDAAGALNLTLREGVYLGVRGPMFETPAEIRMYRCWGADAVGMSTIHEATMASALNMEVLGISLLTNMAAGILDQPLTAEEVIEVGALRAEALAQLITEIIRQA